MSLQNVTVSEAFEKVLRESGAVAKLSADGKTVLIVRATDKTVTQDSSMGTVTGRVIDSVNGAAIAGVTVGIQGTTVSAVTDQRGSFILRRVPVGDRIVTFKMLGYVSVTRSVTVHGEQTTIRDIVLKEAPSILSGVVTTATGTQRKLEVGNSIVTLNVDSIMQTAPVRSIVDILDGRVPGMTVQRTSGSPGDPARIRLRGSGSILQNNDPIIVVDGIRMYGEQSNQRNANIRNSENDTSRYATPSPLDQMDPNMIEKIEVLKGPSAASLYGSDAANGVIVITTKRGSSTGSRWSMTGDQGLSYVPGKWATGLWPFGTTAVSDVPVNCGVLSAAGNGCAKIDSIVPFQALNESRYTVVGRGHSSGLTASFLGGNGPMQYAYTASTRDEMGLLKLSEIEGEHYLDLTGKRPPGWMRRPEQLTTWGLSASMTTQLSDVATVSVTSILNNSLQRRTGLSESFNSAVGQLSRMWIDETQPSSTPFLIGHPYEQATSDQTNVTIGAQGQWRPIPWLPLTSAIGINTLTKTDQIFLRAQDDPQYLFLHVEPAGHLQSVDGKSLNRTASVNTTIPLTNKLSLAFGVDYQSQRTKDAMGYFEGFGRWVDAPSSGEIQNKTSYSKQTFDRNSFGWFIEPRLNFQSRFFIMPGFRLDNNGLSGKNAKLNSLPKMNLSWIASDEAFFPFKNVIDLFRLRTAYGVAGVQPDAIDRFRLLEEFSANTSDIVSEYYGDMLKLSALGNTRLRPERSGELEGGFDAEVLRGRLKLDVTLYRKMRHDAIVGLPLASSVGGGNVKINLGAVRDQGSELGLDAQILEGRSLGWNVNATFSTNGNKVIRLNGTDQTLGLLEGGGLDVFKSIYRVGYPLNGAWTVPIQSYHDLDGNGLLSPLEVLMGDSAVFMGSKEPSRTASLNSGMTFLGGRVSLYTMFNYIGKVTQTDGMSAPCVYGDASSCQTSLALARFNTNAPLDEQAAAIGLYSYHSAFGVIRRVSSWRFQSASLNVNVGPSIAHLFRGRSMSVALQGSNLGLWTNYRGKDPNVNGFVWGSNLADLGQLPQPRTWALRVSLGN